LLVLTVSACATSTGGSPGSTAAPASTDYSITTLSKSDLYQIAVQEQARFKGVDVHWVNPPDEGDLARYDLAEGPAKTTATSN
jgi:hypothetical protein